MINRYWQDKLCIIVLESPYQNLSLQEARVVFSNIIDVKIQGYTHIHEDGVLPVDTTDFLGTHLIVANRENPFEDIYMSYKSISYKTCEKYNVPFPFLTLLQNHAHKECAMEMERILKECKSKGEDLAYNTGLTMNPKIRNDENLRKILKEMITTFVVNYHNIYEIPHWATLGICKVKTDQYFIKMGLKEISNNPLMSHPYLKQAESRAVISMNQEYSDYVFHTAEKYQGLWDNRITINLNNYHNLKKQAA